MAASTVLDEIATYLGAASLGLAEPPTLPANLFAGRMFDTPDAAVALIETTGEAPDYDLGARYQAVQHPHLQVLVRGVPDDYSGPRLWAERIMAALDNPVNQVVAGVYYLNIDILQAPFELDRDAKERVTICFNISIWKSPSPMA